MFLRPRTARRMKAAILLRLEQPQQLASRSHRAHRSRGASRERCRAASSSSSVQTSSAGRRIVIATRPGVVAGGSTIWMRSPPGSDADRSGDSSSMRCRVEFATSFARRLTPVEVRERQRLAAPALARLDEGLARPVDAELGHFADRSGAAAARAASARAPRTRRPPADARLPLTRPAGAALGDLSVRRARSS